MKWLDAIREMPAIRLAFAVIITVFVAGMGTAGFVGEKLRQPARNAAAIRMLADTMQLHRAEPLHAGAVPLERFDQLASTVDTLSRDVRAYIQEDRTMRCLNLVGSEERLRRECLTTDGRERILQARLR